MIFNDNTVDTAAQAMQALLSQQLSTVGYDKTLVYTITDDSTKDKGSYTVSDGSVSFIAYTEDTKYKKDDKVYVTIPQGDFTQKKVIIGKFIDSVDEEQGVGYISPEDRIISVYEQQIDLTESERFLKLYNNTSGQEIWGECKSLLPNNDWEFIENTLTRLKISCNIQSTLSDYNVVSGDYGLKLILLSSLNSDKKLNWDNAQTIENNIVAAKSQGFLINYLDFPSKDMIGNIYNYKGIIHQSKLYNIANIGNIFYCVPCIYYKKNFKSLTPTGEKDLSESLNVNLSNPVIEFKNLTLTFGFDQSDFLEEDNLIIYNDPRQDLLFDSATSINKSLYAYNIILNSQSGKFENHINFTQNEYLYWYEDSYVNNDKRGGKGWQLIQSQFDKKLALIDFLISSKEVKKSYKAMKVIVDIETNSEKNISSNIIDFANSDYGENASGLVWLEILDDQKDYKNLYGENYAIINFEDFQKVRTIKASIPETRTYNKIRIEWLIPRGSSMILDVYDNLESGLINSKYLTLNPTNSSTYDYTDDYYSIVKEYEGSEVLDLSFFKLSFGIKQFYQPTFNRNQIICKVYYNDDQSYCDEGRINLSFGRLNNNGTAYDFGVFFEDPNKPYLIGNKTDSISIYCTLSSSKISLSDEEIDTCLQACKFASVNGKLTPEQTDNSDNSKATITYNGNGQSDIVVASIIVRGVTIQAYLPIPLAYEDENSYTNGIQGNNYAYYDSYGSLIKTEQFPLKIYGQLDNKTSQDITITTATPKKDSLTLTPVNYTSILENINHSAYSTDDNKQKFLFDTGKTEDQDDLRQTYKYTFTGSRLTIGTVYYLKNETDGLVKNHIQKILIGANNEFYYIENILGHQDGKGATVYKVYSDKECTSQIVGDFSVNWSSDKISSKHFLVYASNEAPSSDIIPKLIYLKEDGLYTVNTDFQYFHNVGAYGIQQKYGPWYVCALSPAPSSGLKQDVKIWPENSHDKILLPYSLQDSTVYSALSEAEKNIISKIKTSTYKNYYLRIYSESGTFLSNAKFTEDNTLEFETMVSDEKGYITIYGFEFDSKIIPIGASLSVDWRITSTANEEQETPVGKPIIVTNQEESSEEKSSFIQYYPIYISNDDVQYYLEAYSNNTIYWQQPLLIQQNNYEFEILNNWDGQTAITDTSIMSPCIGAGSKNESNQFSGVLMGKIGKNSDDKNPIHGLYGFSDGAQAFGFKEDGTAFIGKSGAGRIYFDGDKGTIASAQYELGQNNIWELSKDKTTGALLTTGMLLDLDDPKLHMVYSGENIVDFTPKENKMRLKSPEGGMSIDLVEGIISTEDLTLNAYKIFNKDKDLKNGIKISSTLDFPPLQTGWFGNESETNYAFKFPTVKLDWQGGIESNLQVIDKIGISNNRIVFGQFYSPNFAINENDNTTYTYHEDVNMLTFELTQTIDGRESKEYYDLYLNMWQTLITSSKSEGESSSIEYFFDIRPNFNYQSDSLEYFYSLQSYRTKYKIPLAAWKPQTGIITNKQYITIDPREIEFDSKKYKLDIISYNEAKARYFKADTDQGETDKPNAIILRGLRMQADWIITRNGEQSEEALNYYTAIASLIFGFNNYETKFEMGQVGSLGGRFIDIGVLTSTDDTWKAVRQRHEFFVDAMGTTHISDLKVPPPHSGDRTDVISYITLGEYIKEVLKYYKLIS